MMTEYLPRTGTKLGRGRAVPLCVLASLAAIVCLQSGCGPRGSSAELRSFKDPYFPETYSVTFDECVYRTDAGGDPHFMALAVHESPDASDSIRQYLDVRVYWKPVPGKTPSNSTTLDAMLSYTIHSAAGVAVYRGSGFVFLKSSRWNDKLIGQLESGSLRLETQIGEAGGFIGDSTITATLVARPDSNRTIDLMREAELLSGATSTSGGGGGGGREAADADMSPRDEMLRSREP